MYVAAAKVFIRIGEYVHFPKYALASLGVWLITRGHEATSSFAVLALAPLLLLFAHIGLLNPIKLSVADYQSSRQTFLIHTSFPNLKRDSRTYLSPRKFFLIHSFSYFTKSILTLLCHQPWTWRCGFKSYVQCLLSERHRRIAGYHYYTHCQSVLAVVFKRQGIFVRLRSVFDRLIWYPGTRWWFSFYADRSRTAFRAIH